MHYVYIVWHLIATRLKLACYHLAPPSLTTSATTASQYPILLPRNFKSYHNLISPFTFLTPLHCNSTAQSPLFYSLISSPHNIFSSHILSSHHHHNIPLHIISSPLLTISPLFSYSLLPNTIPLTSSPHIIITIFLSIFSPRIILTISPPLIKSLLVSPHLSPSSQYLITTPPLHLPPHLQALLLEIMFLYFNQKPATQSQIINLITIFKVYDHSRSI